MPDILLTSEKRNAILCLGCIIKGETKHDDYIANAVASGIMQLGLTSGVPVIFGVVTTNTPEQAMERAGGNMATKVQKLLPQVCNLPGYNKTDFQIKNQLATNMKIIPIDNGHFKLDGGAMFGVVPKTIWSKMIPADEFNLCSWTMRSLLLVYDDKVVLIDTGLGDKQDEKFFSHYYQHGDGTLMSSLQKAGYQPSDVTDVILTHFHFDHVGGAVVQDKMAHTPLLFPTQNTGLRSAIMTGLLHLTRVKKPLF